MTAHIHDSIYTHSSALSEIWFADSVQFEVFGWLLVFVVEVAAMLLYHSICFDRFLWLHALPSLLLVPS